MGNFNNFESKIECKNFCWDYLSEEEKSEKSEKSNENSIHSYNNFDAIGKTLFFVVGFLLHSF